jgi:MFS family permease
LTKCDLIRQGEPLHVSRWSLLRFTDFRRVVLGQFVSQASDALMLVVLAKSILFADSDGPTPVLLAQAALSGAVPLVLAGPIAGYLADRWPRKQILVSGQGVRALLAFAAACALYMSATNFILIVFVFCLCATRVLFTARVASVRHLVRQHELVAADSLMLIVGVVAAGVGASVFAVSSAVGPVMQLALVGVGHFLAAYCFDRTRAWLGGDGETAGIHWRTVLTQLSSGKTRFAVLSTAMHRALVGMLVASVALDVDQRTNGAASGYALALGVAGAAGFVGSVTSEWANERIPRRTLTVGCYLTAGLTVASLFVIPGVVGRLVAVGVCVFLFQNLRVASDATIQANAAPGSCGRVFAAYDITFNLAYVAGLIAGLGVSTNASILVSFAVIAPLYLIGSIGFASLERGDSRRGAGRFSSRFAPRNDVLAHDAPADQGEGVENRRDDDESAGGTAIPREVA